MERDKRMEEEGRGEGEIRKREGERKGCEGIKKEGREGKEGERH